MVGLLYVFTTHLTITLGNCGDQLGALILDQDFLEALTTDTMIIQAFFLSVFCNDRI